MRRRRLHDAGRQLLRAFGCVLGLYAIPVAAGTFTCTRLVEQPVGILYQVLSTCTLSTSYATGGDVPTDPGRDLCASTYRKPLAIFIENTKATAVGAATARTLAYDATNNKVQAFKAGGFTPAGTVTAPTGAALTSGGLTGLTTATNTSTAVLTVAAPTINCTAAAPAAYAQGNTLALASDANGAALNCGTVARTGLTGIQAPAVTTVANALAGAGTPAVTSVVNATYAPTFTGTAVAAATLVEETAATDLSAITFKVLAFCR